MAIAARDLEPASPPWTAVLHDWVSTVDHKKIGILYILMSLVFLVVGGLEAVMIRWQLVAPRREFLGPDVFNQLFTMHGTTMVFFMGCRS
jgi:cytochrome c oxidase subunit 1